MRHDVASPKVNRGKKYDRSLIGFVVVFSEREKSREISVELWGTGTGTGTPLVSLVGVEDKYEKRWGRGRGREAKGEGEGASGDAPSVGRWGAEWPS